MIISCRSCPTETPTPTAASDRLAPLRQFDDPYIAGSMPVGSLTSRRCEIHHESKYEMPPDIACSTLFSDSPYTGMGWSTTAGLSSTVYQCRVYTYTLTLAYCLAAAKNEEISQGMGSHVSGH
jgi:hypothetical protein